MSAQKSKQSRPIGDQRKGAKLEMRLFVLALGSRDRHIALEEVLISSGQLPRFRLVTKRASVFDPRTQNTRSFTQTLTTHFIMQFNAASCELVEVEYRLKQIRLNRTLDSKT